MFNGSKWAMFQWRVLFDIKWFTDFTYKWIFTLNLFNWQKTQITMRMSRKTKVRTNRQSGIGLARIGYRTYMASTAPFGRVSCLPYILWVAQNAISIGFSTCNGVNNVFIGARNSGFNSLIRKKNCSYGRICWVGSQGTIRSFATFDKTLLASTGRLPTLYRGEYSAYQYVPQVLISHVAHHRRLGQKLFCLRVRVNEDLPVF